MENVIKQCLKSKFSECCQEIDKVYNEGFNVVDIINTLTKVIQNSNEIKNEELRLNFLKEASTIKMRILEGTGSQLQLHGFLSKLCMLSQ